MKTQLTKVLFLSLILFVVNCNKQNETPGTKESIDSLRIIQDNILTRQNILFGIAASSQYMQDSCFNRMDDIEDRQDQLINEVLNRLDDLSRLDTIFNTKHIPVPVDSPYAVPLPFYVDSLIFKIVPWEYEVYGKSKIKVMWDPVYYKEDRCGIEIFLDHDIHHYHLDIGQEDYFETTLLDTGLYYISVRAYPTKVDTFYLNDQMIIAPYYWPPSARSDSVRYHCEEL